MKRLFFIAAMIALTFSVCPGRCEIPKLINYQGMLTDDGGNPLNETVSITFKIYNDSLSVSPGDKKWEETQTGVEVTNGLFNVVLGKVSSLNLDFSEDYWLDITVGAEHLPDRIRLASVGYAYRSRWAERSDTADYALSSPSGPGDYTWTFRITDGGDTTITSSGGWGISRCGNALWGDADSTHVNLGVESTTGKSGQNYKYCTVGGGRGNTASGDRATVAGGYHNLASGDYATVGGGVRDTASGYSATVGGGIFNTAGSGWATVGGGSNNTASGSSATVGGGGSNTAGGQHATVGGGYDNTADTSYATVGGGDVNSATGQSATVGGGSHNMADTGYAAVAGGRLNTAGGYCATVTGGYQNLAGGNYAIVAGGYQNLAGGIYGTVGGGYKNAAETANATVGGGSGNTVSTDLGTVGGGWGNTVSGYLGTVGGGHGNSADGSGATVGGGDNNSASGDYATVAGGRWNCPYGRFSTVPGGINNQANGNYSFAAGRRAKAEHLGTFVWADSSVDADFASTGNNQFLIRAAGGVGIGTTDPIRDLHVAGSGFAEIQLEKTNVPTNKWHLSLWQNGLVFVETDVDYRLALENGGNVGIGTTDPNQKLDVNGIVRVRSWGSTPTYDVQVNNNGDLCRVSSSRRYKKNIRRLESHPDKILNLEPVSFEWKTTSAEDIGLIAEEVHEVIPELVGYDKEGRPDAVRYEMVSLYLLEAMKELKAENEELRHRIEALEGEP
jgi:hypothetical protein